MAGCNQRKQAGRCENGASSGRHQTFPSRLGRLLMLRRNAGRLRRRSKGPRAMQTGRGFSRRLRPDKGTKEKGNAFPVIGGPIVVKASMSEEGHNRKGSSRANQVRS